MRARNHMKNPGNKLKAEAPLRPKPCPVRLFEYIDERTWGTLILVVRPPEQQPPTLNTESWSITANKLAVSEFTTPGVVNTLPKS